LGGKLHLHPNPRVKFHTRTYTSQVPIGFVKNESKINESGLDKLMKEKMVLHPHQSVQNLNPIQTRRFY
jgi:hypothetical protein